MTKVNPLLAKKMVDNAGVLFTVKDEEIKHLDRSVVDEIIRSMYDNKTTGKLIFNFDGQGNAVPELILKGDAVIKLLTEKKV